MKYDFCASRGFLPRLSLFSFFLILAALVLSPLNFAQADVPVTIDASLSVHGPVLGTPILWVVTRLNRQGLPEPKAMATQSGAMLKIDLPSGQYLIGARAMDTAGQMALTVGGTPIKRTLVLGMSDVSLRLITQRGGKPVNDPVSWELHLYEKGKVGGGLLIESQSGPRANFRIPAGGYVVRAAYRGMIADLVMPLAPGKSYNYTINLYAGSGRLTGWKDGNRLTGAIEWQVVKEKPITDGTYLLVAQAKGNDSALMLREGKYLVIGSFQGLWGVAPLSVAAGKETIGKVTLSEDGQRPRVVASP